MSETPDSDQTRRLEAACPCGGTFYSTEQPDEDEYAELDDWRTAHENCGVVDLDPEPEPVPAIVRWNELADRVIDIEHDGDAEKVIPFPRPVWAHERFDLVKYSLLASAYRSTVAHIPLSQTPGVNTNGLLEPAYVGVRAIQWGNGIHKIGLSKWWLPRAEAEERELDISLTPTEAVELAQAILAAVDLIAVVDEPEATVTTTVSVEAVEP